MKREEFIKKCDHLRYETKWSAKPWHYWLDEMANHDAEQRAEIARLRREVALLKADDAERCALIRDMEEEERKKDAVIEQQRQEIERLQNTAEELENVILETGETET